jgi:hypothetical protein
VDDGPSTARICTDPATNAASQNQTFRTLPHVSFLPSVGITRDRGLVTVIIRHECELQIPQLADKAVRQEPDMLQQGTREKVTIYVSEAVKPGTSRSSSPS